MAGNARFHNKLHRKDHHTSPTTGYPDSATDPIASPSEPFQGDFVVNGLLSTNSGIEFLSADIAGDFLCENLTVRDTVYTNFLSGAGTETIISDGALTGNGNFTMTMDFRNSVYANTPIFIATNNLSAKNIIYGTTANLSTLNVTSNAIVNGNLTVQGNLSALGDVSVIETNIIGTSSLSVTNVGPSIGLLVKNDNISYPIASFQTGSAIISQINNSGLTTFGTITATGNVKGLNVNLLESTSGIWNSVYTSVSSTSGNWNSVYNTSTSNSAKWEASYNSLTSTSANWDSVYNTSTSNSAKWEASYNSLTSTSANWNSVYNTVSSTSADFLSGNSTLNFIASTGTFNTHLSTNHIHIVRSLYVPVSSVTLTGDITLSENSPTYLFINPNGTARNVELPPANSAQNGLTFIVKNTETNNHTIDIHYNGGLSAAPVTQITNGNYKQVIANGGTNTWLAL